MIVSYKLIVSEKILDDEKIKLDDLLKLIGTLAQSHLIFEYIYVFSLCSIPSNESADFWEIFFKRESKCKNTP